jgi:hypothetical protein
MQSSIGKRLILHVDTLVPIFYYYYYFKKEKKWINRFYFDLVPNQTKLMSAAYSARPVSLNQLDYAMNEISVSIKTETIKRLSNFV